jgi:hypothetical protein
MPNEIWVMLYAVLMHFNTTLSLSPYIGVHFVESSWFQAISWQAFSNELKSSRTPTPKNPEEKGKEIMQARCLFLQAPPTVHEKSGSGAVW